MKNLDDLRREFVDKVFNWLTVLDVFRNDKSILMFTCKCKCGKIINVRKQYVLSNHTTSCGCYKCSKEKGAKYTKWCEEHPDEKKAQGKKYSQWCKDNPTKVAEKTAKRMKTLEENPEIQIKANNSQKKYWKDHPDELAERGRKRSEWAKNNPDKVCEQASNLKQYYADNPDKGAAIGIKLSEFYKTHPEIITSIIEKRRDFYNRHPEILEEIGHKRSLLYSENPELLKHLSEANKKYWEDHPEEALLRGSKTSEFYKNNHEVILRIAKLNSILNNEKRKQSDMTYLLDIIHPSQIDDLVSGNIKSSDNILTRCPICDSYSSHSLHNVFIFSKGKLKLDKPPLCEDCRLTLATSRYEDEIADFISTLYNGECIRNTRKVISPLELDLYYPEKKIAIEFNGDYWHDDNHKSNDYHYNKFKLCYDKCILLVSVFESEWLSKNDAIKSYLVDLFNDKENPLSFNSDRSLMNNNYPSKFTKCTDDVIEESFVLKNNNLVYTCGYSKIIK